MNLWRYTTTINHETIRSTKGFSDLTSALDFIVDNAHAIAKTFQGGHHVSVSSALRAGDIYFVVVHQDDEEVARFELTKITSDDSLVRFKMDHPYLHQLLQTA